MSLDPDLWRRARPLLDAALELPPPDRAEYLRKVCGDDAALRQTLERLIAAAADDEPFLDALPAPWLGLLHDADDEAWTGRRVGSYRLLRLIAIGGMGAVYLAQRDDGHFDHRVAMKLVRSGPLAGNDVARFRRERQILAWLEHPNIARLLDGGVADIGPYLVMEYIEGEPIDTYCERQRLGVAERVRLFLTVCDAVEYAHRNLVVHRDLKPGNIFVSREGEVKLLDFGIAQLLDTERWDGPVTGVGLSLLTPEYASPEQIRGDPLTTACDVYGLGAVLYQLLTGRLPHNLNGLSPAEIEHTVCDVAPARPGTLARELRGDLETILLRTLHPDPARRYGSASALADDLRRHLERRPVRARPDTLGYRFSRFVRRHVAGVAAAALLLVVLVSGILATAWQGALAQRRFENVRALSNALLFDLHDAVRDLPGATPVRELLVSRALTYLDELRAESPSDPGLELELAAAYEQIGEIQGDPHRTNLGDLDGALSSYGEALALRQAVWSRDSSNAVVRQALGVSYGRLAVVTSWSGRNDEAIRMSRRGIELLRPLHADGPAADVVAPDLGRIEAELGWWLIWAGNVDEGMAHLDTGQVLLERVVWPEAADPDPAIDLWRAYSYRVDGLSFTSRHAEALRLLKDTALPHLRATARRHPNHPGVLYGLHVCYDFIGNMYLELDSLAGAAEAYDEARRIAESLVQADSANQKAFESLARSHVSLANVQVRSGNLDHAVASYRNGIAVYSRMFERNPRNSEFANMLGNARRRLCRVLTEAGRPEPALEWCLAGEQILEQAVTIMQDNAVVRANLGSAYVLTARVYRALARTAPRPAADRYLDYARARYGDGLRLIRELDGTRATPEFSPDSIAAELATLPAH